MGTIGWVVVSLVLGFVIGWLGRSAKKCVADEAVESLKFKLNSVHQELDACRGKLSEFES